MLVTLAFTLAFPNAVWPGGAWIENLGQQVTLLLHVGVLSQHC